MNNQSGIIVGAGLSGLIAATVFNRMEIIEASPTAIENHKAVLRFRTNEVGRLTGIDFKPVTVNKGIWCIKRREFIEPNIRSANQYSMKVSGGLHNRSVWNLEQATRYIAPEDFYSMLLEKVEDRIEWDCPIDAIPPRGSISTIPMPVMAKIAMNSNEEVPEFSFAKIVVRRFHIANSNVFQTVYIPHPDTSCYRISITGNLLIAEFVDEEDKEFDVLAPFGLCSNNISSQDDVSIQKYGKIAPIDEAWRRAFMHKMTVDHGVYSLGRFATWRNILLDDVVKDIDVIKSMMGQDKYGLIRSFVKR